MNFSERFQALLEEYKGRKAKNSAGVKLYGLLQALYPLNVSKKK